MRVWGAALAACVMMMAAAAPAAAQSILLAPGQSVVVVDVDGAGKVTEVSRGPAVLTDYDRAVIREIGKGSYADAPSDSATNATIDEAMPPAPKIKPGQIRYTLVSIPNGEHLLIIENGYNQGLRYQARLKNGDRSGLADVCLVKPMRGTYEHWPFKVDSAEIFNLRLNDWQRGDPEPCTPE